MTAWSSSTLALSRGLLSMDMSLIGRKIGRDSPFNRPLPPHLSGPLVPLASPIYLSLCSHASLSVVYPAHAPFMCMSGSLLAAVLAALPAPLIPLLTRGRFPPALTLSMLLI